MNKVQERLKRTPRLNSGVPHEKTVTKRVYKKEEYSLLKYNSSILVTVKQWGPKRLRTFTDYTDPDWKPPHSYGQESPQNVVDYWATTRRESGNPPEPTIVPYPLTRKRLVQATVLIAKLGYIETMRTLTFMATPYSGRNQWPYSLKLETITKAYDKLILHLTEDISTVREYVDFIGPVGMKNLGEPIKLDSVAAPLGDIVPEQYVDLETTISEAELLPVLAEEDEE
jgi:hypothetical protein